MPLLSKVAYSPADFVGREELVAELPSQDQINADETATKEESKKVWLWAFAAARFTVFAVRSNREATAVDELLTTAFEGIVTCDRAKMYWRAACNGAGHI